jgi:hypothetical protein
MREPWRRRGLYVAALLNVLGGLIALANPAGHFAQSHPSAVPFTDPVQTFYYQATWINVIAWGVGYFLAARVVNARTPVLLAGAGGKLAYFFAGLSLYLAGRATGVLLGFGILDLAFAAFFVYVVWLERSDRRHDNTRLVTA